MEQHFNTPAEVIDNNMKAGEGKAHLPLGKMILLGIMAGAFIALGGATSSTAAHAIDNVGLARFVAGIIFPVGLMIIVFVGGELFTGNCLIVMDVVGKKVTWFECIRNLIVVYFSNLIGALIIDTLIYFSGNLDYTGGLLGAYAIKVAVGKVGISPLKGITSGILCNILVCIAILMAAAATDIVGKVWAIFFPIMAFVVGGFEHCVANMFYIPVGHDGCTESRVCCKGTGSIRPDRRADPGTDSTAQPEQLYSRYHRQYLRRNGIRRNPLLLYL